MTGWDLVEAVGIGLLLVIGTVLVIDLARHGMRAEDEDGGF